MIPYTYFLLHIPTGLKYYGVRYSKKSNPADLWKTYFSSSKRVKELINEHYHGSKFFMKERTSEHQQKIADSNRGKKHKPHPPFSEEHKKKLSLSRKGIILSEETRKKISISNTGKKKRQLKKRNRHPHSLETRNKIKKSWEERRRKFGFSGRIR